jgi:hypothetical protein
MTNVAEIYRSLYTDARLLPVTEHSDTGVPRRGVLRLAGGLALAGAVPATAGRASAQAAGGDGTVVGLERIGRYLTGNGDGGAEIVAYDPGTQRLFVVNSGAGEVEALDVSDPTTPTQVGVLDAAADVPNGGGNNSVDVADGIVGVAVENEDAQRDGRLAFYDADSLELLAHVRVGALPDKITLTPDGNYAVSANEGEPDFDEPAGDRTDPRGSISVVDLSNGVDVASVETLNFTGFDDQLAELRADGVRVYGASADDDDPLPSTDIEPEYVTVTDDGQTAFVSLQEANAIATVDIPNAEFVDVSGLGFKDFSLPGNEIAYDDDGNFANWPVNGMYQVDALSAFTAGGQRYVATANEGDARDYEVTTVGDLDLDPEAFDLSNNPYVDTVEELQSDEYLGGLEVTSELGDVDGDGRYEELYAYGGRSFSVWRLDEADGDGVVGNSGLQLVYDSGSLFEELQAEQYPDGLQNTDESGPETESVTVGQVGGRTYAFVGQEKGSGIVTMDVTRPAAPEYVSFEVNRDYSIGEDELLASGDPARAGDFGPEGLEFVSTADSPVDDALLMVGFEISGTVGIFRVLGSAGADSGDGGSGNPADIDGDGDFDFLDVVSLLDRL